MPISSLPIPLTNPITAPEALPPPTGTLVHVLIGRGIQNYTCASASASATPTPIGAIATLYDARSIPNFSTAGALITSFAYSLRLNTLPTASDDSAFSSRYASMDCTDPVCSSLRPQLAGVHYFRDPKTPMFDLNTANGGLGSIVAAKKSNSTAPATARAGSVDWLLLEGILTDADRSERAVSVYRVETVGGKPPGSCGDVDAGRDGVFERNYAAQYWFYV